MLIAIDLITKERIRAKKGLRATCPCCKEQVIAKCGESMIHHWSHQRNSACSYGEGEGEWHETMKDIISNFFDAEIEYSVPEDRSHIADIYVPESNSIIEIQHSPISSEDLDSRYLFWKRMRRINSFTWLVDISSKNVLPRNNHIGGIYYSVVGRSYNFFTKWHKYIQRHPNINIFFYIDYRTVVSISKFSFARWGGMQAVHLLGEVDTPENIFSELKNTI
jgi:hypothetical protein